MAPVSNSVKISTEAGLGAGEIALRHAEALGTPAAAETVLVARCLGGDGLAFSRLVALHEGMVVNLSLRLLGDREEARDLAQDVFLQVYRTLGRFEGRSSLKTWIYRITVNQCRNRQRWWRRRKRDRARSIEDLSQSDSQKLRAPGDSEPSVVFERREAARRVQEALLSLSFDHRSVLVLREVEELSCEEIAQTLGLPEGTVKSRLARGREGLKRALCAAAAGSRGKP